MRDKQMEGRILGGTKKGISWRGLYTVSISDREAQLGAVSVRGRSKGKILYRNCRRRKLAKDSRRGR